MGKVVESVFELLAVHDLEAEPQGQCVPRREPGNERTRGREDATNSIDQRHDRMGRAERHGSHSVCL